MSFVGIRTVFRLYKRISEMKKISKCVVNIQKLLYN